MKECCVQKPQLRMSSEWMLVGRGALQLESSQHGAESIVFASVPRTVLWTDDHIQAVFARQEYGVKHVWTQLVVGARADSGAVESKVYFDVSAKLAGFGYFFHQHGSSNLKVCGRFGLLEG